MTEANQTVQQAHEAQATSVAEPSKTAMWAVYALYGLGFFTGITFIAGVIMAYVCRSDVKGTYLESHVSWQIRTFWWSLIWSIVGGLLAMVFVGFFVLAIAALWTLYRVILGAVRLNDSRPV